MGNRRHKRTQSTTTQEVPQGAEGKEETAAPAEEDGGGAMIKTKVVRRTVVAILICDKCNRDIAQRTADSLDRAVFALPVHRHKDLNRGHECDDCRRRRHRAYDAGLIPHPPQEE